MTTAMPDEALFSETILARLNAILADRRATLAENLVTFAGLLRQVDLDITSGRVIDAARGLAQIDVSQREDVRHALRACLVSHVEQLPLFDALFDLYWGREL